MTDLLKMHSNLVFYCMRSIEDLVTFCSMIGIQLISNIAVAVIRPQFVLYITGPSFTLAVWAGALAWWLVPLPFTPEFGVRFPVTAV